MNEKPNTDREMRELIALWEEACRAGVIFSDQDLKDWLKPKIQKLDWSKYGF